MYRNHGTLERPVNLFDPATAVIGLGILAIVLAIFSLYLAGLLNYLFFHSVVETFSIIVGCGVFMVAWNCRRLMNNDYLLFVGMAYLWVALIDFVHVLIYPGMGVFESLGANSATQFWIAARYTESLCLLLAPLFLFYRLPIWPAMWTLGAMMMAVSLLIFGGWFPDCFIEGQGLTAFKVVSEFVIALILAGALVYLYKHREHLDGRVFWLVAVSIVLTIASEMSFTLYADVYGFSNFTGHLLKLVSFYLIYKAIIETGLASPYDLMFRDLHNSKQALERAQDELEHRIAERTRDLMRVNQHLRDEVDTRRLSEHALRERVKELGCLSEVGRLIEAGPDVEDVLGSVVEILPPAWQFPESATASIEFAGKTWQTGDISDCESVMLEPLVIAGTPEGSISVGYLDGFPDIWEGPFLEEERELIGMVAQRLARFIEQNRAAKDRAALELQLRQSQKMQSIGRLAGGVAHDFNNMLSVILGNLEITLEKLNRSDAIYEELQAVQQAANSAADLTRQLLGFARKQTVEPRVLDVNDVIGGMTRMLERLIGENIKLLWMPGENVPAINMDPSQVDQILVNLVVNARDAIGRAGHISIESVCEEITDETSGAVELPPGRHVRLTVRDDGMGMDEQIIGAIFEPFFTTKPPGQGTGLGLATVYGIVRQNAGNIRVESEPGNGAAFHVYLPAIEHQPGEQQRGPEQWPSETGKETILLVEDETSLLVLLARQLESLGYTAIKAGSPQEALGLVRESGTVDLVITDVVMPGMNGSELYSELKKASPSIHCLFMSGYTANVVVHDDKVDQQVLFLQKPFTREALAAKIREALGDQGSSANRPSSLN